MQIVKKSIYTCKGKSEIRVKTLNSSRLKEALLEFFRKTPEIQKVKKACLRDYLHKQAQRC